jgi:hypothetical protein
MERARQSPYLLPLSFRFQDSSSFVAFLMSPRVIMVHLRFFGVASCFMRTREKEKKKVMARKWLRNS